MKSISITRLKHDLIPGNIPITFTWNEKHLDYEIETREYHIIMLKDKHLEMKSISITRLKQLYIK